MIMNQMPDWELVLGSMCRLQKIVPEAVVVGGSTAAIHADHRLSVGHDHVVRDLKSRFDIILEELNSVSGWESARKNRPVLILGGLDGIETGIRQLRRSAPL